MKLIILETKDPYLNLAVEEYLFNNCDDDVFMLWQNEPSVVIGKNQNAFVELKTELAKEKGINVVRRITGGGAVYHDLGNVNYTFISSVRSEKGIDFSYFTEIVIEALAGLGVVAELSGRNDLLADGKKFSGNAQHSNSERTLHHGTLLFDCDLEVLSTILNVDEEKLRSKAIKSTRSRVTNLLPLLKEKCTVDEFIGYLAQFIEKKYSIKREAIPINAEIESLRTRNRSAEWLYPEKEYLSGYSVKKKKRYPFGSVEISLEMLGERIRAASINGDFFGCADVSELCGALEGHTFEELEKIDEVKNIGDYIFGMTPIIFIEQITE